MKNRIAWTLLTTALFFTAGVYAQEEAPTTEDAAATPQAQTDPAQEETAAQPEDTLVDPEAAATTQEENAPVLKEKTPEPEEPAHFPAAIGSPQPEALPDQDTAPVAQKEAALVPEDTVGAIGVYANWGVAAELLDMGEAGDGGTPRPRAAGGFGFYFDYHFTDVVALTMGLDFLGRGARDEETDYYGSKVEAREKVFYLDIPVGIKANFNNLRLAGSIAMCVAIQAKTTTKVDGNKQTLNWNDPLDEDGTTVWDGHRRLNIAPRIALSYAIPFDEHGSIVPGITWNMHLLNNAKDFAQNAGVSIRYMNIMFNLGLEFRV